MSQDTTASKNTQFDSQYYIAKYLVPVWEHKWIVFFCTLTSLAAAVMVSLVIQPVYSSYATTQLERTILEPGDMRRMERKSANRANLAVAVETMRSAAFEQEVLDLISDRLYADLRTPLGIVGQVKNKLVPYIRNITGLKRTDSPEEERLQLLARLGRRIEIQSSNSKGTITIEGSTFAQDLAPVLVQSYIDVWIGFNLESNRNLLRKQLAISKVQLADYQGQLKDAENELRLFRQEYQISSAVITVTDPELQTQLDILHSKKVNAQARYEKLVDLTLELERQLNAVSNNIRVINPPHLPLVPSEDMRLLIMLIGFVLGAAVAIGLILGWDYYRGNIRHRKDILEAVNIPLIGSLPNIK
jgi:uncharacterized protein involved in exopolysaccharide biosynthesis